MIDPKMHVEMCNAEFAAGKASRDAEIESLRQQLAEAYRNIKIANAQTEEFERKWYLAQEASEFDHSEYRRLREELRQQLADSQKREVMLREWAVEAVGYVGNMMWSPSLESQGRRVIAATEPK